MFLHHLSFLRCPSCHAASLAAERLPSDQGKGNTEIYNGFFWCRTCLQWYPVINGVLDFLTGELVYSDEVTAFWEKNRHQLKKLGLYLRNNQQGARESRQQKAQQEHSDWFADNDELSYTDYATTPFWHNVDRIVLNSWGPNIPNQGTVLEPGCGQGIFTRYLMGVPFASLLSIYPENYLPKHLKHTINCVHLVM